MTTIRPTLASDNALDAGAGCVCPETEEAPLRVCATERGF